MYALKYDITLDFNDGKGFTREELQEMQDEGQDIGACDQLMLCSVISPSGEGFSLQIATYDGQNLGGPMKESEIFKIWSLLSSAISEDDSFTNWQRLIAKRAFESVQLVITGKINQNDKDE